MPTIPTLPGISVQASELSLGDRTISRLAALAGQTPFYAYSRQALSTRVAALREHLPENTKLYFSIKANPMSALVQHMASLVDGLDVASIRELQIALDTGIDPDNCVFTGPSKTLCEIEAAVACGVIINIESRQQLEQTAKAAKKFSRRARVMLRLHPRSLPDRGHMKTYSHNQFGVEITQAPGILKRMQAVDVDFRGFHCFWGSQFSDIETICHEQRSVFDTAADLSQHAPTAPSVVSLGGGLAAAFYQGEAPVDLPALGVSMRSWLAQVASENAGPQIALELGRYLVADAGIYVCRVVDIKTINEEKFLITDGGLHQHLAASGYFGQQAKRRNYHICIGNKAEAEDTEVVNITGRLCSTLDRIADNIRLPRAEVGDYIVVFASGAYGPSFSPGGFLSHPSVMELMV